MPIIMLINRITVQIIKLFVRVHYPPIMCVEHSNYAKQILYINKPRFEIIQ